MRGSMIILGLMATLASCRTIDNAHRADRSIANVLPSAEQDKAAIIALEANWSRAFLTKDYALLDDFIAPEFKLVAWRTNKLGSTGRAGWMVNVRKWDFRAYQTKVLDVVVIEGTAVATVQGSWIVDEKGREIINNKFFLTDTWVRRNGRWQVVLRHSQTID